MSQQTKTGKSPYVMLALGIVVGGLAVGSLPRIMPAAHAQQDLVARPIAGITAENMAALRALDNSFASLAQYIEPSVVHIESRSAGTTDLLGRRTGEMGGVGTGVIFRPDGWIITNDHVVAGFDKVTVRLQDGREFPGTVRRAQDTDLAVVKIDAANLPAAVFGDSGKVRAGQFAMAVGSPFNLDESVTIGHISALNRTNAIPDAHVPLGQRLYSNLIQTDAAINMGNSGGPLINIDGQVVGINSAIYSGTGGSVGIGFAIPSNQARMIAEMLIERGKVTRAFLGLTPENLKPFQMQERHLEGGAVVTDIPNDQPAAMAGIKKDDVIVRVGTFNIRNQQDVRDAMLHYAPGTTVPVEVLRGTDRKSFNVKLGDATVYEESLIQKAKAARPQPDDQLQMPFGTMPDIRDFGDLTPRRPRANQNDVPALHSGKAKLGVTVESVSDALRSQFGIVAGVQGAVVTSVAPGSVAESLGIQPGYLIQQLGTKQIRSAQDLIDAMKDVNYGDTRQIKFGKFTDNSQVTQSLTVTFK